MAERTVQIVGITQQPRLTSIGRVEDMVRVEFMYGEFGPFLVQIPTAEFTKEKRDEAIEKFVRTLRDLP